MKCLLLVYLRYLKIFFPQWGELCPVEKVSYKVYSPPKCTCNGIIHKIIHTHSYKICISLYECLCHAQSSLTFSYMQISMYENLFQNKRFLFLKPTDQPLISDNPLNIFTHLDNPPNSKPLDNLRVSNHWTISENPLLDNPPIEFIGQTSDIIYWTTLRISVTGQPSEYPFHSCTHTRFTR